MDFPCTTGTISTTGTSATGTRSATDTPTLTLKTIKTWEAYANSGVTQTLLEDVSWNVAQWVETQIARQLAAWESDQFINGDGTTEPEGILTATVPTL
jgi:HK97 family phage major capsid protein